jgi:hypothetical protein
MHVPDKGHSPDPSDDDTAQGRHAVRVDDVSTMASGEPEKTGESAQPDQRKGEFAPTAQVGAPKYQGIEDLD